MASAPVRLGISGKGADEQDDFTPIAGQQTTPSTPIKSQEADDFQPLGSGETITYSKNGKQVTSKVQKEPPPDHIQEVLDFLRPLAGAGAVGMGAKALSAAGAGPGISALGGLLAGAGTDTAIQAASPRPPASIPESLTNTGGMLAANEFGGQVLGKLFSGLKEFIKPGSVIGDSISALNPTYSQLKQKLYGKAPISKWIEDVLASGAKAESIETSAALGNKEATGLASSISGHSPAVVSNPMAMAKRMSVALENNLTASYVHSDAQAQTAKMVAKANPLQLPDGSTVEGPINIANTLKVAQDYLEEKKKLFGNLTGAPDPEKPLIAAAQRLLTVGSPQFDQQTGQIIRSNPISFDDAWNFKKAADKYGYGSQKEAVTYTESLFKDMSRALNDDIDASIGRWANDPNKVAKTAWQNAKATVAQRHLVFGEDGVRQLINTVNSPVPEIDRIIGDPVKLQRALTAGELPLPGGKVQSSNLRKDLQGYQLMKLMNDSWESNTIDPSKGSLNVPKLINNLTDARNKESYNLLFSQQNRADINQLFKNLAITQQSQSHLGSYRKGFALYHGAVTVPAALITGHTTLAGMDSAISGIILSGMGLAKVMTNPKLARPLVALSAGQPAGVSDAYLSRALVGALQGAGNVLTLVDPQGRERKARIEDGELIPER